MTGLAPGSVFGRACPSSALKEFLSGSPVVPQLLATGLHRR